MSFYEKRKDLYENIEKNVTVASTEGCDFVDVTKYAHLADGDVWTAAIQAAVDENDYVFIPDMGKTIYLDNPIYLGSNKHIKVEGMQKIALVAGTNTCMLRNKNIISGRDRAVTLSNPDTDISVEGGFWTVTGNHKLRADKEDSIFGAWSVFIFSNVERITIKNLKIHDSHSYSVQICNCRDFYISDIEFVEAHRDGIHLNGPARYGIIQNLKGRDMGDDMVAFNAWDWNNSALCFGELSYIITRNLDSEDNEFRILPGEKLYDESENLDCDIYNCCFENIRGVYTFKLYGQPNISNAISKTNDVTGKLGDIYNLYFDNIVFPKIRTSGLNALPVDGMFEICANCKDIYINGVTMETEPESMVGDGIKLIKVGPLSATWTNGSDNPEDWGEVFYPDAICEADGIYLSDVAFVKDGKRVNTTDLSLLTKTVALKINEDYPNTKPKGGTGFGTLKNCTVE